MPNFLESEIASRNGRHRAGRQVREKYDNTNLTENLNVWEELSLPNSGEKCEEPAFVIPKTPEVVQWQFVTFVASPRLDPESNFMKLKSDARFSALFDYLNNRAN